MEQQSAPPNQDSPGGMLQAATTIAGLAFALVAFVDIGPTYRGLNVVSVVLELAGLAALGAAGYALQELWQRAGMGWRDALFIGPRSHRFPNAAIAYTLWAVILLGLAYVIIAGAATRDRPPQKSEPAPCSLCSSQPTPNASADSSRPSPSS